MLTPLPMRGARLASDLAEGFRGHGGRHALAAFAVAVGVMAFAILVLVVTALQQRIDAVTAEFGADVVSIGREDALDGSADGLGIQHADLVRRNFQGVDVATLTHYRSEMLGRDNPLTVIATDAELVPMRGWTIIDGRNLDARDVREQGRVALASRALARDFDWRTGSIAMLDDVPFTIVGVVDAPAANAGDGVRGRTLGERFVLVPWSSAAAARGLPGARGRRVEQILVAGGGDAESLARRLGHLLAQPDVNAGELSWVTARRLVADLESLRRAVVLGVGTVALLCLVLGGTTLMSLMVLNVRERIPEIGLRLSLGARRSQVSALFVVEAAVVTLAAGVVGTVAAHVLAALAGPRLPLTPQPGWISVLAPTLVALLLGALFSWWPARLAARVSPAEAIRDE